MIGNGCQCDADKGKKNISGPSVRPKNIRMYDGQNQGMEQIDAITVFSWPTQGFPEF